MVSPAKAAHPQVPGPETTSNRANQPHANATRPPRLPQHHPPPPRNAPPATSTLRTAQQPDRRALDVAPRDGSLVPGCAIARACFVHGEVRRTSSRFDSDIEIPKRPAPASAASAVGRPTGRPCNAVVAPSSQSPRELPPVPPSPVDERVASSSSPRARNTKRRKPSRASARRHLPERSYGSFPRVRATKPGPLGDAWVCSAAAPSGKAPLAVAFTPTLRFQSPFIVANSSEP